MGKAKFIGFDRGGQSSPKRVIITTKENVLGAVSPKTGVYINIMKNISQNI